MVEDVVVVDAVEDEAAVVATTSHAPISNTPTICLIFKAGVMNEANGVTLIATNGVAAVALTSSTIATLLKERSPILIRITLPTRHCLDHCQTRDIGTKLTLELNNTGRGRTHSLQGNLLKRLPTLLSSPLPTNLLRSHHLQISHTQYRNGKNTNTYSFQTLAKQFYEVMITTTTNEQQTNRPSSRDYSNSTPTRPRPKQIVLVLNFAKITSN